MSLAYFQCHRVGCKLVFPFSLIQSYQGFAVNVLLGHAIQRQVKFDAESVRLFILQTHYRSPIEFSDEQLREAEAMLDRYYQTAARALDFLALPSKKEKGDTSELLKASETARAKFTEAMDDDFNTAGAIGHIFELIRELNRFLDSKPSGESVRDAVQGALDVLGELSGVLRLFGRSQQEWYSAMLSMKVEGIAESDIDAYIEKRNTARADKDYAESDRIRDELADKGIVLEDKPGGVTGWRVKI